MPDKSVRTAAYRLVRLREYGLQEARTSSPRSLTEADAIRLAQQGNAMAFERVYRLHCRRVYCLCLRMVNNRTDAEDLTQEAFLQVLRKVQTFRAESRFSTWLHRLTVNVVLMRLRVRSLVDYSVEQMSEQSEEKVGPPREFGVSDLTLTSVVDRLSLQRAVDQLAPGYKQVFILHDVKGYGHNEIAKLLGCSLGNSKSQLFKARMRLRELLKDEVRNAELQKPQVIGVAGIP